MKNAKLKLGLIAVTSLGMMLGGASASAAPEKRCTAGGQKVECPTVTEEEAKKASAAFLKEGDDMEQVKAAALWYRTVRLLDGCRQALQLRRQDLQNGQRLRRSC